MLENRKLIYPDRVCTGGQVGDLCRISLEPWPRWRFCLRICSEKWLGLPTSNYPQRDLLWRTIDIVQSNPGICSHLEADSCFIMIDKEKKILRPSTWAFPRHNIIFSHSLEFTSHLYVIYTALYHVDIQFSCRMSYQPVNPLGDIMYTRGFRNTPLPFL